MQIYVTKIYSNIRRKAFGKIQHNEVFSGVTDFKEIRHDDVHWIHLVQDNV